MMYLIGGAPRTGKSLLAKKILERKKITNVSTDILVHMLKKTAPELGVKDESDLRLKSDKFYPFLFNFIKVAKYYSSGYVIEGDAFMPKDVIELSKEYQIRACFLGYSKLSLETVLKHVGDNNWLSDLSEGEKSGLPDWIIRNSQMISEQCKTHGIAYFDLSKDFESEHERAYEYLTEKSDSKPFARGPLANS